MPKKPSTRNSSNSDAYFIEDPSFSLSDFGLLVANQIQIILITPSILCTFTIIYLLVFSEVVYTSKSKIMSSLGNQNNVSKAIGIAAQFGIDLSSGNSELNWTYSEILKSRSLARNVVKRKFDTSQYGSQKELMQILTYGNKQPMFGYDTLLSMSINSLLDMINVYEDKKTSIVTLRVNSKEPKLAADINEALIEELDRHQKEYNKSKTSQTRQFIQDRIKDTEKELMATEESLKDFRLRNRRIENSPGLQLEEERLSREVTVLTGVFTTLKQSLETTKIEEVKKTDYVVILDPPEVPIKPTGQNRKMDVLLAGVFGLGLGIGLGFFRETIKNLDQKSKEHVNEIKLSLKNNLSIIVPFFLKNKER